jgi:hypothetical protein
MIRRDYILRVIEECIQALIRIRSLRENRRLEEARQAVDAECEKLAAVGAGPLAQLSETEIMALVAQGQPTLLVGDRLLLLISFLREAGEVANAEGRAAEAREIFLKALHLLLGALPHCDGGEHPDFAPRVNVLVDALAGQNLPIPTQAMLMQHYESTGQFAKSEDMLYSMLDATANDRVILALGHAFYERILRENDASLTAGNLPRNEAEEGFRELERRLV